MIVTCPRCLTKFNLPDENLSPGVEVNLRCSRCKEEFSFSLQDDNSVKEDATDPLPAVEESDASIDLAEIDESEPPAAVADASSDIEFDEDFEAIVASDTEDVDPIAVAAEDEFDVDEIFSSDTVESQAEPEGVDNEPVAASVDEETIFELSDDFDSDESDNVAADSAIEELALDIDDIDLGDIEFDSLDDGSAAVESETIPGPGAKSTQIDDDDDFAGLLDPEADAEVVVAASSGLIKGDKEEIIEKKVPSETEKKSTSGANQKRTLIMVLACFLVMSLALWAGYGLWQRFSVNMAKYLQLQEISNQRLRLPSGRVVIVLRGKVVNNSPKLVTDLKIKGVLVDKSGKELAEVITSGGVSFSEKELDLLDSKKLAMLENSAVNLPPNGGELPFMIAFYDYPDAANKCFVELSSFKVKKGRIR